MGLRINTNMAAFSAQRVMGQQGKRAEHAAQALASGTRIVKAGDDAAGLAISENIKSQTRGDRILVLHYRRRKNSKKMQGHRQLYTMVEIGKISG